MKEITSRNDVTPKKDREILQLKNDSKQIQDSKLHKKTVCLDSDMKPLYA